MSLKDQVSNALKAKNQGIPLEVFDTLVEAGLLRETDPSITKLLIIIKEQQDLIEQLIKDADKHD